MKFINYLLLFTVCVVYNRVESVGNGNYVSIKSAPYFASLVTKNNYYLCGGSIIADTWILTAAHCAESYIKKVITGRSADNGTGSVHNIEKFIVYGDYELLNDFVVVDIALVKLETPIVFNEWQQPIIISQTRPEAELRVTIYGLGIERDNREDNSVLKETELTVMHQRDCQDWAQNQVDHLANQLPRTIMCTSSNSSQSCHGDSGSPAVLGDKLVGVVSGGSSSCRGWFNRNEIALTTMTLANAYYDWIVKVTGIE